MQRGAVPGRGHRVWRRPVTDAVDGEPDHAHAQYGDDDQRGDHEYGDVDAQKSERRRAWGQTGKLFGVFRFAVRVKTKRENGKTGMGPPGRTRF